MYISVDKDLVEPDKFNIYMRDDNLRFQCGNGSVFIGLTKEQLTKLVIQGQQVMFDSEIKEEEKA